MALGRIGKYDRVDVLGHGASGIVYLAWDTMLKKQIALKEIDIQSGDIHRFLEEARVMDRMRHPNIVRVNGVDRIDGHILIDMEYVEGKTLQQLLRSEGRIPPDRAVRIAVQVLDALDYAHGLRTVHRDIKPANILISAGDKVKLVDFGLAEILATNSYAGGAGTYAYMAPEDFAEDRHSDHQSDIWAVGITLYEMLTGGRPFKVAKPRDPFSWRKTLLESAPIPVTEYLPEAPAALQVVFDKALEREKSTRYATAGAFRDDLIRLLESGCLEGVSAPTIPLPNFDLETSEPSGEFDHRTSPFAQTYGIPNPSIPPVVSGATTVMQAAPSVVGSMLQQVEEQAVPARMTKGWLGFGKKELTLVEASIEPDHLDFGLIKKGDERTLRCTIQFRGGDGRYDARVINGPTWLRMTPLNFQRKRQTLTLTAVSERAWQTGEFHESLILDTSAGQLVIPLSLTVLKPRLRFSQVMLWFVPLCISVLLPAVALLWGMQFHTASYLMPAGMVGCGLLSCMLLITTFEADLGSTEKSTAAILTAIFSVALGVTVKVAITRGHPEYLIAIPATGVPIGLLFILQCFTRRYWKVWAGIIVMLSFVMVGVFSNA
ncbi:MAG: serine/threonine-protein kinase, partial [Chthonomonadales bacterium]